MSGTFRWKKHADGMRHTNPLLRALVWCSRLRYRQGYGVHSPFAFNLITRVFYERWPYYAYQPLDALRHKLRSLRKQTNPARVDKLLLRLANYTQPCHILELGTHSGLSACYLASGCASKPLLTLDSADQTLQGLFQNHPNIRHQVGEVGDLLSAFLTQHPQVGLVHFNSGVPQPAWMEQLLPHTSADSLFVIEGIHDNKAMLAWWNELKQDPRTGISFDLYDLGLLFFDHNMYKQHYLINF